ncbi:107aa long hypothetical protein [Pyrococcus horikoshii OT3]|uniref:Uncharacterized protein n=1 Tax=Pyrococcus horikoshii (strain ATCC 700860 / DSM 12428 / JCM 9974 / NBRC 100139 / OT-3) TaxID=70601 RepID=O58390_PYRHO|nr:107aa long hypothetical protein [Pyrococcus horikoshii OT3]
MVLAPSAGVTLATNYVRFNGNVVTNFNSFHTWPDFNDFSRNFMPHYLRWLNPALCPLIPLVYMKISSTYAGCKNLNENFSRSRLWNVHLNKLSTIPRLCLHDSYHLF